MSAHAFLAPSSAHQWLSCTAAPHACKEVPDQETEAAQEGTRFHLMVGEVLQHIIQNPGSRALFTSRDWYRLNHGLSPEQVNPTNYPVEMLDFGQEYVERTIKQVREAAPRGATVEVLVEQRLDISNYVPDCFGTADLTIGTNKTLYVTDAKYGKGVPVYAKENPQLKLYALGAYTLLTPFFDFDHVELTIDQPRLNIYDKWDLPLLDLLMWGEDVKPIAKRAFEGVDVEFVPSEDNCRFCRIRYTCAARAQYNLELDFESLAAPAQLSSAQIAEVLPRAKSMEKWAKDIQAFALKHAGAGEKFPGFKLVRGRSSRYIAEPEIARQTLHRAGFTDVDKPRELLGLTALTSLLGKKTFEELMKHHLVKPQGRPVLVPESDPRPGIPARDFAVDDFGTLEDEDEST